MAQITIYMNSSLEEKVKEVASSMNLSISKFIASILEERVSSEWSSEIQNLSGSWRTFPDLEEIRKSEVEDTKREEF
ncbi:hypothetical protein ThvES_00019390 [Thiovulum sp. ES]|nr:hypothetical protein ThvES_00019390 [Thiovulum sp. ES]